MNNIFVEFYEGDSIKMTKYCSGCNEGQIYKIGFNGNRLSVIRGFNENGTPVFGCNCVSNWIKVETKTTPLKEDFTKVSYKLTKGAKNGRK